MREILFRGKAINRDGGSHRTNYKNGDWVYGLLTRPFNERYGLYAEMRNEGGIDGIEVDHETISQWTGLIDKNGIKVFEGDIVSKEYWDKPHSRKAKSKYLNGVVKYHIGEGDGFGGGNEYKCWAAEWDVDVIDKENEYKYGCCSWGKFFDCEVIGNIYDNPELLGGDE